MSSSPFALLFAQAANAAAGASAAAPDPSQQGPPAWTTVFMFSLLLAMVYFGLLRPHSQQKKKQEETIKGARTGDKVVTTSGIHGVITNVKDSTVIMRIADNVKIELEKTHIDKIIRPDSADAKSDKAVADKAPAKA
jgi:preprotein translocase subunit YajC